MRTAAAVVMLAGLSPLALAQTTQLLPSSPQTAGFFGSVVAGVKVGAGAALRDNAVVASPGEDLPGGFVDAGRVRVYDSQNGTLLRTIDPPNKQPNGEFGSALAGLDRINAGEFGDILVGAPKQRPGVDPGVIAALGRAYIFDGHTGQMLRAIKSPGQQSFSHFGWAVASLGDLNADGYTDYAVSAPGETIPMPGPGPLVAFGQGKAGRVYVFSGQTGSLMRVLASPTTTRMSVVPAPTDPTGHLNFGYSIAGVADVTGDGKTDLLVGAPQDGPNSQGRAYLFNGVTGALVRTFASPVATAGGRFGHAVAGMADVSGDARGDVVVGAPGDRDPGPLLPMSNGRVHVFSGAGGTLLRTHKSVSGFGGGSFGSAIATVPDISGDNRPEVVIAAPNETAVDLFASGRVYIYNGVTGTKFRELTSANPEVGGRFGTGVAGLRVPNGRDAVLVGAESEDPGNVPENSGRAYVVNTPPFYLPPVTPIFPPSGSPVTPILPIRFFNP